MKEDQLRNGSIKTKRVFMTIKWREIRNELKEKFYKNRSKVKKGFHKSTIKTSKSFL